MSDNGQRKYLKTRKKPIFGMVDGERRQTGWQLVLRYKVPNPDYVEPPKDKSAEDTRASNQRRRELWAEVSKVTHTINPDDADLEMQTWRVAMESGEGAAREAQSKPVTVAQYINEYIDTVEAVGAIRESAVTDYRTSARRIAEGMGDTALRDLTAKQIQAWEGELLKSGRGVNTVLKYHRLLNIVCNDAVDNDVIGKNPCRAVKKPRRVAPSPNSLTVDGFARLAATLDAMEPTAPVTAATIALYTGMREGEVCGLKWKCYDPKAGTISVEKSIGKAGGKTYETEPKTEASRRSVPVAPQLADMLSRRRDAIERDLQAGGITLNPQEFGELYVVGTAGGKFCNPVVLSRSWKALSESLGLVGTQGRSVTFHDLRHSFATRAIAAGADVKAVAAVLGHSDAHVTLNVYADADKEAKRRTTALVASLAVSGATPYAIEASNA